MTTEAFVPRRMAHTHDVRGVPQWLRAATTITALSYWHAPRWESLLDCLDASDYLPTGATGGTLGGYIPRAA